MVKTALLFVILSTKLMGQNPIDRAISYLQQFNTEEIDLENQSLILQSYLESPLEINNLSRDDIANFPLLNQRHYYSIRKYIQSNGDVLSKYELINLYFFNKELVELIYPFIAFFPHKVKHGLKGFAMHKSSYVIQPSVGFKKLDSTRYLGGRSQELFRFQILSKNQRAFLTWKKNKGEKLDQSFLKVGFQTEFNTFFKQVNFGAFVLHLNEGLVHSNKLFNPKNNPIDNFYKLTNPLKYDAGSNESNYENGIAIKTKYKKFKSTYFWSRNAIHGSNNDSSIYSIKTDGLYRTASEIEKKNTSKYSLYGTHQTYDYRNITFNLNSVIYAPELAYKPEQKYYNTFYTFNKLWNTSVAYKYSENNFLLRGEVATDREGNLALTNFLVLNLDESNFLINGRYFSHKYTSFRSNTISESARIQNEKGVLFSLEGTENSIHYYLSADFFSFTAPKYLIHLPSFGKEYLGMFSFSINSSSKIKFFGKRTIKMKDNNSSPIDALTQYDLRRFYMEFKTCLPNNFELQTRTDLVLNTLKSQIEKGKSSFLNLSYKTEKSVIGIRATYFNTDNWNTRIYLYEHDVLYHFYIPAFYDQGVRYFINFTRKIGSLSQFWVKFGKTQYFNKTTIGSGNDEIQGNVKSEIRAQLRIKF